jgi:hypothetical protein
MSLEHYRLLRPAALISHEPGITTLLLVVFGVLYTNFTASTSLVSAVYVLNPWPELQVSHYACDVRSNVLTKLHIIRVWGSERHCGLREPGASAESDDTLTPRATDFSGESS